MNKDNVPQVKTVEDSARAKYIKKYGADSSNIYRAVYIDGFTDGLDSIDSELIINILEYFDRGLSDVAEGSGENQPMHSEIKEALSNLRSQPPISIFHKNQSRIAELEAERDKYREALEGIVYHKRPISVTELVDEMWNIAEQALNSKEVGGE